MATRRQQKEEEGRELIAEILPTIPHTEIIPAELATWTDADITEWLDMQGFAWDGRGWFKEVE